MCHNSNILSILVFDSRFSFLNSRFSLTILDSRFTILDSRPILVFDSRFSFSILVLVLDSRFSILDSRSILVRLTPVTIFDSLSILTILV